MIEQEIRTIDEYVKLISQCDATNIRNNILHNEKLFFRGHTSLGLPM